MPLVYCAPDNLSVDNTPNSRLSSLQHALVLLWFNFYTCFLKQLLNPVLGSNKNVAMNKVVIQSNIIKITDTITFHYVSIGILPAKRKQFWRNLMHSSDYKADGKAEKQNR